jgi:mannose/cellobiose epimerase-like protein (N-acyl-D-glucosamine 2-epimerase family)
MAGVPLMAQADAQWREAESQRLLDRAVSARHPAGGFGRLDASGRVQPDAGRPLWVNCRMVHCLSLGVLLGRTGDGALVDEGVRVLQQDFADPEHDGWFADADLVGDGRKEAYGHAFVVLAGASATVAGRPGGRALLDQALDVLMTRFWDDSVQMPIDTFDRAFTEAEPYRGGNASMHLVEALLAAADATGEQGWRQRALAVAHRLVGHAEMLGWRMPEHFDPDWVPLLDYNEQQPRHPFRPYGITPGHGLEWARLLLTLEAAMPEPPPWLRTAAIGLASTAVVDGWDEQRGGFVYTTDRYGTPVVRERFHWVVCEAIGAAWALRTATGDEAWADRYQQYWQHAQRVFVDPAHPGLWRHEVNERNEPGATTWTDRPDTYHALQATLLPSLPLAPGLVRALAG